MYPEGRGGAKNRSLGNYQTFSAKKTLKSSILWMEYFFIAVVNNIVQILTSLKIMLT